MFIIYTRFSDFSTRFQEKIPKKQKHRDISAQKESGSGKNGTFSLSGLENSGNR